MAIVNGVLLPFVVLLGFFVMTSNFPHKDYSLLFPVFSNGNTPIFSGMLYAGSGLIEIILLFFMQHRIKGKVRFFPLLITVLILFELILSPVTGAIAEFGPYESARMRFTAFEQWRLVTFGHFL